MRHILVVGATATAVLVSVPFAAQQAVFKTSTDVVPVTVAVTQGRSPVPGLELRDFELTDNGVKQTIDAVLRDDQLIDVTIVMPAVPASELFQLKSGSDTMNTIQTMLRPADRLRIVTAGGDIREDRPMRPASTEAHTGDYVTTAGTSLFDGLFAAFAWPVDPERRHLVVVFGDGDDSWSTLAPERLSALAARSDAVIHAILFKGPPKRGNYAPRIASGEDITQRGYRALDTVVVRSGGQLHLIQNRADGFQQVLSDFRSSYLLRYTPRNVPAPGWHKLDVKVTRSGSYAIRARQGYER